MANELRAQVQFYYCLLWNVYERLIFLRAGLVGFKMAPPRTYARTGHAVVIY
jgi:hypothetical protein